jgi:hypothetical protein
MKKIALLILLALPMIGSAQTDQKNSVKMKFSGATIMANNLSFNYERKLSDAFSVNIGLNYTSKKVLPLKRIADEQLGPVLDSAGVNSDILNTKFNSWGIGLQFKYFFKKKALRGLYLAPYFGFQTGGLKPFLFDFPDQNDINVKHEGTVNAKFSFLGGGIGIGNQWVLNNGLTFDVLWLGLGAGGNTIRLRGEDTSGDINYEYIDGEVETFLAEDGSEFDKYRLKFTSDHSSNHIEIVGKHIFPYMKVLNISVGFSF